MNTDNRSQLCFYLLLSKISHSEYLFLPLIYFLCYSAKQITHNKSQNIYATA